MTMTVTFPGAQRVRADYEGLAIETDQNGTMPAPYDLFLASLATCAGFYALAFMQQRDIATAGSQLTMDWRRDRASKRLESVDIRLQLPPDFPEKYRQAIVRAMDQCAVKRALDDPPTIVTTVSEA